MYLPTDMTTIYNVMIDAERTRRNFWRDQECRPEGETDRWLCNRAAGNHNGRMWALMDLRDGSYII